MYRVEAQPDEATAQRVARQERTRGYSAMVRFCRPASCFVTISGPTRADLEAYLHNSGDKRRAREARRAAKA